MPEVCEITAIMLEHGWDVLWYANPLWPGIHPQSDVSHFGPRWHAGTWTGPDFDLLCVVECDTKDAAEAALSPAGWTPLEAVRLAASHAAKLKGSPT